MRINRAITILVAATLAGCGGGGGGGGSAPTGQGPTVPPPPPPPPPPGFSVVSAEIFAQPQLGPLVTLGWAYREGTSGIEALVPGALAYDPTDMDYFLGLPFGNSGTVLQVEEDRQTPEATIRPVEVDGVPLEMEVPGEASDRFAHIAIFHSPATSPLGSDIFWYDFIAAQKTLPANVPTSGTREFGGIGTGQSMLTGGMFANSVLTLSVDFATREVSGTASFYFLPCFNSCEYVFPDYAVTGTIDAEGVMTLTLFFGPENLTGTATAVLAGPDADELAFSYRVQIPAVDAYPPQEMVGTVALKEGPAPPLF